MSFLKVVYNKLHPPTPTPEHTNPESRALAKKAVERATVDLHAVEQNEIKVTAIVDSLREQLIRNHFGELIETSMRGRI